MLLLRRARIPVAVLAPELCPPAFDPLDPAMLCNVTISGTRIENVAPAGTGADASIGSTNTRSVDLAGALTFPGFVDAHVHLDKTHSWERAPNRSGTFAEALDVLWRDKANWTADDLRRRAGFALRCAFAHGTRAMRTHVDTGLPWAETSHAVMAELRETWRGRIALQTVPLCRISEYSAPHGPALADLALRYGASALGGMPEMSPDLPAHLDRLMAIAQERGVGLDFHVDESGNPDAECLRAVADAVLRNQFSLPVVCGHCCSLAVQPDERQRTTIAAVKAAGLRIVSLPLCNLYLQDRRGDQFPRTPRWRGLTLVQDLLDAGIPVACASDNVRDAFYAWGDYNLTEVLLQSVRLAHLDSRLSESPRVVTTTAADLLELPEHGRIERGAAAHLVVTAANSFSEFLSRPTAPRWLVDGEGMHAPVPPAFCELGKAYDR